VQPKFLISGKGGPKNVRNKKVRDRKRSGNSKGHLFILGFYLGRKSSGWNLSRRKRWKQHQEGEDQYERKEAYLLREDLTNDSSTRKTGGTKKKTLQGEEKEKPQRDEQLV